MGIATHGGSRTNLLGTNPPPALVAELSSELHVRTNTPPCFIWSTADDRTVPVINSLKFADALRAAHVSFALHIYEHGPHGQGLGAKEWSPEKFLPWTGECAAWLEQRRFARPTSYGEETR
jgi:acetyl esterase/lipase